MWRREIDLQVGDMVQIGSQCLIVVETNEGEVTFKVCTLDDLDSESGWAKPTPR